jgi:hypothetical protein
LQELIAGRKGLSFERFLHIQQLRRPSSLQASLAALDLNLSGLKSSLRGIQHLATTSRQQGEIMGLEDGVHSLAMEVLEMDHASVEEVLLKVEIVAGPRSKVQGLSYSVSVAACLIASVAQELTSLSSITPAILLPERLPFPLVATQLA